MSKIRKCQKARPDPLSLLPGPPISFAIADLNHLSRLNPYPPHDSSDLAFQNVIIQDLTLFP